MIKKYKVTIDDVSYEVSVEALTRGAGTGLKPAPKARTAKQKEETPKPAAPAPKPTAPKPTAPAPKPAAPAPSDGQVISAPLPGNMWKVLVKPGQAVKKGDIIFIIEAMKMENEIFAPCDGTVGTVSVAEGTPVNTGEVLCTIE